MDLTVVLGLTIDCAESEVVAIGTAGEAVEGGGGGGAEFEAILPAGVFTDGGGGGGTLFTVVEEEDGGGGGGMLVLDVEETLDERETGREEVSAKTGFESSLSPTEVFSD